MRECTRLAHLVITCLLWAMELANKQVRKLKLVITAMPLEVMLTVAVIEPLLDSPLVFF